MLRRPSPGGAAGPPPPASARAAAFLIAAVLLGVGAGGCQSGAGEAGGPAPKSSAAAGGAGADSLGAAAIPSADSAGARAPGEKGRRWWPFGRRGDQKDKEVPPVPVELVSVLRRDLAETFASTATLEAEKEAAIVAKTAGQIARILVEEGDTVTAGQTLLVLDDAEAQVRLERAKVEAASAEREFQRVHAMWERGHVSEREMADIQTRREAETAARDLARLELEHTRVKAPFAGLVTQRLVDLGEHAAPGTPLFTLVDQEPLLARLHMPERQVARVESGQEAIIVPDAAPRESLPGRVTLIAPAVDPRTGTVKVTVELEGTSPHARPGSFVRVHIVTQVHAGVLAVPKRALVSEAGETFVFSAVADSVTRVPIATGTESGEFVEVLGGLEEGDRVVRVGQGALKSGSRIKPVAAPDSAAALAGDAALDAPSN